MLTNSQDKPIIRTVDPAVVPQEESGPKYALIVILEVVFGGMLIIFNVFFRSLLSGMNVGNASNTNTSAGVDERT